MVDDGVGCDTARRRGGDTPLMGSISICEPKGYVFFYAVFVRNTSSILAVLVSKRAWFLHSSREL